MQSKFAAMTLCVEWVLEGWCLLNGRRLVNAAGVCVCVCACACDVQRKLCNAITVALDYQAGCRSIAALITRQKFSCSPRGIVQAGCCLAVGIQCGAVVPHDVFFVYFCRLLLCRIVSDCGYCVIL